MKTKHFASLGQTRKYVCFRLPTVPKFRSPTLFFYCRFWGFFFTIDFSHRKRFLVSSLFLLQLILKLTLLREASHIDYAHKKRQF